MDSVECLKQGIDRLGDVCNELNDTLAAASEEWGDDQFMALENELDNVIGASQDCFSQACTCLDQLARFERRMRR